MAAKEDRERLLYSTVLCVFRTRGITLGENVFLGVVVPVRAGKSVQIVCDRKVNERFLGKNFVNSKNNSIFALAFGKGALLYISKAHFYQWPIRLSVRTQDFHS